MQRVFKNVRVKGNKIQLRPILSSDAHSAYRMVKNEEILKWLLWDGPEDKEEIANTYQQWENGLGSKRDCFFAIEKIDISGIIGCISLTHPKYPEIAEVGYWLAVEQWGNGHMSDAVRLACHLGFKHLRLEKIYSPVFIGNDRSKRVLEHNSFCLEGILRSHLKKRGEWRDVWYMSLLRSNWEAKQHFYEPSTETIKIASIKR